MRAAQRLLPRAPGARSSQLNVTKARTNGRPKRTGAYLRAMEATRPAGARRGARGSVLRLDLPPLKRRRAPLQFALNGGSLQMPRPAGMGNLIAFRRAAS